MPACPVRRAVLVPWLHPDLELVVRVPPRSCARIVRGVLDRRAAAQQRSRGCPGHRRRGRARRLRRLFDGGLGWWSPARARPARPRAGTHTRERNARDRGPGRAAPRAPRRTTCSPTARNATPSTRSSSRGSRSRCSRRCHPTLPASPTGAASTPEFLADCLRLLGTGVMEPMWNDLKPGRCRSCS